MKKILFGILTFLGIGLSFCSADSCSNSCSIDYDDCVDVCNGLSDSTACINQQCIPNYNDCLFDCGNGNQCYYISKSSADYYNDQYFSVPFKLLDSSKTYTFSSFTFDEGYGRNISLIDVCYTSGEIDTFRSNLTNFTNYGFTCVPVNFLQSKNGSISVVTFNTPFTVPSGFDTVIFRIDFGRSVNVYKKNFSATYNINSDIDFLYINGNGYKNRVLNLIDICYSAISPTPKLKINYGSESTTWEILNNNDLHIYLKSPVTVSQDGHTYTYVGSTGLNLFYNGTSQRYNKSKLYLNTPSRYSKNIFTPVCL